MADNKNENQQSQTMLDPIVYRDDYQIEGFDPSKLQNADINISQYGDDSSEKNYNNPALRGGENTKYEGENTKNSQVAYNPNATVEGLDPNYKYGQAAQMQNSQEANYIARRNDEIASALYNAGKTSIEDVTNFLNSQQGFFNSNENERANTINAVWKRLGQMASENQDNNADNGQTDNSSSDASNEALSNMESDLMKSTAGELYGKVTADSNQPVKTLEDQNSVYKTMAQSRINNLKALQAMDSESIAASIISGTTPYGDQGMRDLMQYDPAKYQEVQNAIKQIRGQMTINSITQGNTDYVSSEVESKNQSIENEKSEMASSMATSESEVGEILQSIDNTLSDNSTAVSAEGTMASLTADINKLNTRLKNLKKEANQVFKGDVPQHIVNAYIANRTAEIQDKLKELQYNYDAAYTRYQTELSNTRKEREYENTLRNLKLQEDKFEYQKQQDRISNNQITWQDGVPYQISYTEDGIRIKALSTSASISEITDLRTNRTEVVNTLSGFFSSATDYEDLASIVSGITNGTKGGQCGYFANNLSKAMGSNVQFGSTLNEKLNPTGDYTKSSTPVVGSFAVFTSKGHPENGHVGYVTQVNEDGSFVVKASNNGDDEEVFTATYKPGSALTFIVPKLSFEGGTSQNTDYEVPMSIYDTGYMTVDPNSEAGKKLRDEYLSSRQQQGDGQLVAGLDGTDTAAYKVISSDGVTPIDFRQRIYNLVPATLKNSDTELKNLYTIAKDLYEAGYSADEAAMVFYGLDPRDDKTGLLKPLIYTARTSGKSLSDTFYGSLGSLLESGSTKQAIRLVENSVLSDEEKEQETKAISIVRKIQELEDKLDGAATSVGPLEGTVASWTNKYIKGGGENAQIAADIAQIYSQIRKEMMGTAVTETESKANEGMYPSVKDKMANIKVKLNSMKSSLVNDINGIRTLYDLPEIDEYTLVDIGGRAYLYGGIDTSSMDIQSNTNRGN